MAATPGEDSPALAAANEGSSNGDPPNLRDTRGMLQGESSGDAGACATEALTTRKEHDGCCMRFYMLKGDFRGSGQNELQEYSP